jgi:hypothetical protein
MPFTNEEKRIEAQRELMAAHEGAVYCPHHAHIAYTPARR